MRPQEAVAALYACMSFVVAQAPKEHDATIRESLKSAVPEIVDLARGARDLRGRAPMTWQQIGDVARNVPEQLKPRVLSLTIYDVSPDPLVFKIPITILEQAPLKLKIEVESAS